MTKERFEIKSECPECGCGLIDNTTPDEFRKKNRDSKENESASCSEGGSDTDGSESEEKTAD